VIFLNILIFFYEKNVKKKICGKKVILELCAQEAETEFFFFFCLIKLFCNSSMVGRVSFIAIKFGFLGN